MTSSRPIDQTVEAFSQTDTDGISLLELAAILAARWRLLAAAPLVVGIAAFGIASIIPPTFTAQTTFVPPQQQQSPGSSALAALGALSGIAGGISGIKTPADQYVALMQSANVEDRIVDRFKLMEQYETKYHVDARKKLEKNVRIALGKKDGLISVEADASEPKLAADIANQYVAELRRLTSELSLTEAQQRRAFFEAELKRTRLKLTEAQQTLQSSGFSAGALRAEPKAAADGYARLKAEVTSAEVRLQTMRRAMADGSPDVQQQITLLGALRAQLMKLEGGANSQNDADYLSRYREFKYQETLFELFGKQYELARMDESREGALIQVVDIATPPERKSRPQRLFITLAAIALTFLVMLIWLFLSHSWTEARALRHARAG